MASANQEVNNRIKSSAISTSIISVFAFYIGNRLYDILEPYGTDFSSHINEAWAQLPRSILSNPLHFNTHPNGFLVAFCFCIIIWLVWLRFLAFAGHYRTGEEQGSARWGTMKEARLFKDEKNPDNNLIFTKNCGLALHKPKYDPEHDRNLNVMVIGGSGSGKTFNYVTPNIMQLNTSFFITDPKGTLLEDAGYLFTDNGYDLKSFNTIDFSASMHYNPLAYVKTDTDILSFVNCFIMNTNGDGKSSDPFWENAERMLYTALIALLRDWFPPSDYTLPNVLLLLSMAEAKEDDENFKSPLDLMFYQIETGMRCVPFQEAPATKTPPQQPEDPEPSSDPTPIRRALTRGFQQPTSTPTPKPAQPAKTPTAQQLPANPGYTWVPSVYCRHDGVRPADCGGLSAADDFALSNYKKFKVAAGKTLKSIIISCNVRLAPLATAGVKSILDRDDMELDKMGDPNRKVAVFGILSDTDKTFSFLFAILMWQAIDQLCRKALSDYGGKLPTPVHFIFDEFANIGTIPQIEETIAVTRSRNIGITIILQSKSQLESKYDKKAGTIIDCCDTTLFLGGKSTTTNDEISKMIGKETVNQMTFGESNGQSSSASKNTGIQQRDLIDPAEIGKMSRRKAITLIAGAPPFMDDKFDPRTHPRYRYIADKRNPKAIHKHSFDFKKYMAGELEN